MSDIVYTLLCIGAKSPAWVVADVMCRATIGVLHFTKKQLFWNKILLIEDDNSTQIPQIYIRFREKQFLVTLNGVNFVLMPRLHIMMKCADLCGDCKQ